MKLLSTILAAMILAPVSGLTCGTNVSNDCQAEWNNANNNNQLSAFWNRCKTEGGANPLRNRCKYCCYGDNAPKPTKKPAPCPTAKPTGKPSFRPTNKPTAKPTAKPTGKPSPCPTNKPTAKPTGKPTAKPSFRPTESPTAAPTANPTERPTESPSANPTESPTTEPSSMVTFDKYGETEAPYDKGVPTESPCPDDVELLNIKGDYPIDLEESVQILQQDTSSVTVRLVNAWTSKGETIDHIFYEYKESSFSEKCYEEQNVDGGEAYQDITIQCMHSVPIARLNICVADTDKNPLSELDDAEVPQCCHPDLPEDADVVCYSLAVHCESTCDPEEGKSEDSEDERTNTPTSAPTKLLRSPSPTSSPTVEETDQPSASPTAAPTSNPTDSPTFGSTESPTQCWEHIPPQIVSSQCYKMETESLPDNAIEVLNHNEDTVKVVIALPESDATGLAVRDDSETCDIVDGNTGEFEGECIDGYATFVIMVFKEEDFDKEECEACNYDDLEELDETFCAYSIEIPCESIPVDCEDSSDTESPESTEEPTVNENPTASPTLGSTESPTDCWEPIPPKIQSEQCYKMETESLPDNAIEVLNHNEDTVKVVITLPESDATGLAIRDDSETCDIVDGNTGEFEGECINGFATFVIMVFKDEEFSKEECEACNYDDLEELEETFCAYLVEIPCESVPCTTESPESTDSPTINESPTAFPTFAPTIESTSDPTKIIDPVPPTAEPTSNPTESPTTAPTTAPTSNPTESPTTAPTSAPTGNPTESPTMSPTLAPTDQPSDSPTAKAVTATESPSASPTIFELQQGGCRKPPGCDPYAPGASASCMIEGGCPELTPNAYYPDPENCAGYCFSTGTNAPCRYEVVDKTAPQIVDPYGKHATGYTWADIKDKNNAQCSKRRKSPLDGTCGITPSNTANWGMWGVAIPNLEHCKYWPDRDGGKSGNLGTPPKPTHGI